MQIKAPLFWRYMLAGHAMEMVLELFALDYVHPE